MAIHCLNFGRKKLNVACVWPELFWALTVSRCQLGSGSVQMSAGIWVSRCQPDPGSVQMSAGLWVSRCQPDPGSVQMSAGLWQCPDVSWCSGSVQMSAGLWQCPDVSWGSDSVQMSAALWQCPAVSLFEHDAEPLGLSTWEYILSTLMNVNLYFT
jgi:hypothetical protein